MKKVLTIIIIISLVSSRGFSQDEIQPIHQRDSAVPMNGFHIKKIKQAGLSKQQKNEVKKYKRSNTAKKAIIQKNSVLTEQQKKAQLAELKKDKHQKLEAILTAEQKEKIKQTKENKPRRGVTDMPNERTAK